jgi:hypothetical protein
LEILSIKLKWTTSRTFPRSNTPKWQVNGNLQLGIRPRC